MIVDEGRINPSSYLRARVFMDLDKPLVRVVPITIKESRRYLVQYEKLPNFCYVCGLVGHEWIECGDGVHDLSKCQWGDWLLVKFGGSNNDRGTERGGGNRGTATNRGRGRGRGFLVMVQKMRTWRFMRMRHILLIHWLNQVLRPGQITQRRPRKRKGKGRIVRVLER